MFYYNRTNNYNKLVLAQHLDDLAESFLMSALHNGQVSNSYGSSSNGNTVIVLVLIIISCRISVPEYTKSSQYFILYFI